MSSSAGAGGKLAPTSTHITLLSTLRLGHGGLDLLVLLASHTINLVFARAFRLEQLSCVPSLGFEPSFFCLVYFGRSGVVGRLAQEGEQDQKLDERIVSQGAGNGTK